MKMHRILTRFPSGAVPSQRTFATFNKSKPSNNRPSGGGYTSKFKSPPRRPPRQGGNKHNNLVIPSRFRLDDGERVQSDSRQRYNGDTSSKPRYDARNGEAFRGGSRFGGAGGGDSYQRAPVKKRFEGQQGDGSRPSRSFVERGVPSSGGFERAQDDRSSRSYAERGMGSSSRFESQQCDGYRPSRPFAERGMPTGNRFKSQRDERPSLSFSERGMPSGNRFEARQDDGRSRSFAERRIPSHNGFETQLEDIPRSNPPFAERGTQSSNNSPKWEARGRVKRRSKQPAQVDEQPFNSQQLEDDIPKGIIVEINQPISDSGLDETVVSSQETAATGKAKFQDMGLEPEVLEAITISLGFRKPTAPQSLAIPVILANHGDGVLCAAETGSGKTVAYLAPVMNMLKAEEKMLMKQQQEQEEKKDAVVDSSAETAEIASTIDTILGPTNPDIDGTTTIKPTEHSNHIASPRPVFKPRHPRAIIILPTRELVFQVRNVAALMSHTIKLRTVALTSALSHDRVNESLQQPVDIIMSTAGTLARLVNDGLLSLSKVKFCVVDEADSLLDDKQGFDTELKGILASINHYNVKPIFVSATLPRSVSAKLLDEYPTLVRVVTPRLHKTVPTLSQRFVNIESKSMAGHTLNEIVKDISKSNATPQHVLIFVNTRMACFTIQKFLIKSGYNANAVQVLHSDLESRERMKVVEEFREAVGFKVLVATDIASRGLDTTDVDHVILYDFPASMQDYLHRVGRTARAGSRGRVTSFVWPRDVRLASFIRRQLNL
ncbi:hypothetical protein SmJEL517_g03201 [Synchytrium microbalum]|uniref:RNA helicase n=1 Tax=Synchytrium microbalum TaxID=1806994 RepID=A0A507C3M4_9FUNG|nr:uncharacterized protein SmJEL517_g03201 [Synchytrium microbalum]TPX33988.1 hypothetical protein SmJEL517_g03201 [Synchytrium microbalum]